jgi:hypothetical protein
LQHLQLCPFTLRLQTTAMMKIYTLLFLSLIAAPFARAQQTIQKTFYHDYSETALNQTSQQWLNEFIQQLKQLPITSITIKSHTDERGSTDYNKLLSQQRALYVLKALQSQLPSTIQYVTEYFGEDSLLTPGNLKQWKNRRTELIILTAEQAPPTIAKVTTLEPYTEDVAEQQYDINLDDTVLVTAKEGTTIKFAPGTFQNKRNERVKGKAKVLIKEYYQPGDILLSGLHTVSNEGLLQTGGMFKLILMQGSDTMMTQTLKPVNIKMPDINNNGAAMNVFAVQHDNDSSLWNDTRNNFSRIMSSWKWPSGAEKIKDVAFPTDLPFDRWDIGRKWTDEKNVSGSLIYWGSKSEREKEKPYIKHAGYTITKTDSVTLTVDVSERFKRRGYKKFNNRTFDTTFTVKYSPALMEAFVSSVNFINCDRFLNIPNKTEFYVRTPDFKGAQLLVYFKKLNAFMPAEMYKDKYRVKGVPEDEEVYLVAIGKRNEEYYYGKQKYTIAKKATADVVLQKLKYEDMKKALVAVGL